MVSMPGGPALQKALGRLVMPMGLLWLVLLFGALVFWHRNQMGEWAAAMLAFVFAGLVGNGPVATSLIATLEAEVPRNAELDEPFDAVIVLGGGTKGDAERGFELSTSGDRVFLGARLFRAGKTPLLVTSGSPVPGVGAHHSHRASASLWQEMGIPTLAIIEVKGATNTSEEAKAHAALIRERGWKRVGLVSSAWHLPRALALFEKEGVRVHPLPADHRGDPEPWRGLLSMIPTGGAAALMSQALWEVLGRAVGR
jgi:uncharacterized SAM-binding protein YcdF (DUF218 family)